MELYGTTRQQLAQVSVKNHLNGMLNSYAQFKKEFTLDEVLNSPMIADPLTLYSCCPNSDGAAAVILCGEKKARKMGVVPVKLTASVLTTGIYQNSQDITAWEVEKMAAEQAYDMASLGPEDLNVIEVHDAFTICEIIHCEDLGICPPGEGGRFIDAGATAISGKTSGGERQSRTGPDYGRQ
ncbi:MAG: thiolase family protein [SAR324 cluster bacterium]|nr:thiolase family protein [SAR324 cluster bacterium]